MKIIISALLCLLLVSCNPTPNITAPEPVTYQSTNTTAPVIAKAPKKTVSYDDLNNYTFVIETPDDTYRIAGDNMKGKRSQLHVSMNNFDVILELNSKGNSTMYSRYSSDEEYEKVDIEYSDINFDELQNILCQVGVDFADFYNDAKFTLESESADSYKYKMDYDNEVYDLTVDKETGIWIKLSYEGKVLMRVTDFSIEKGIIPNH